MQERIRDVRRHSGLTQTEFGERIGVKGNTVTGYEIGVRTPSDAIIVSICREFNVNEQWLRTGQGNMFLPKTRAQEIGEIVQNAATRDPEESMKFFTELLGDMTDAEIAIMYEVFRRHFPK